MPIAIATSLGLELIYATSSELADGTTTEDELVFAGQAEWDGTMREVEITLTHSEDTLIGTAFLTGYRVELDYSTNIVRLEKTA